MTKFSAVPPNASPSISDFILGVTSGNVDMRVTMQNLINLLAVHLPPAIIMTALVATQETTTSTAYADLTTTTDSVTITVGSNGILVILLNCNIGNNTNVAFNWVSFALSGANTLAASDTNGILYQVFGANAADQKGGHCVLTGLTPGSTTIKMKYKVATGGAGSGTGTFSNRRITVIAF